MKYIKKYEVLNQFVKGSFFRYDEFVENIHKILIFLKEKDIKYKICHGSDSSGDMFFILFPNFKNDFVKFPKDEWNEDKPYLPVIDNYVEGSGFEISEVYTDMLEGFNEIRLDLENLENDLADIIQARKYNL